MASPSLHTTTIEALLSGTSAPLRVCTTSDAGRFFVASRDVLAGEKLFEVRPDALVVHELLISHVCANCCKLFVNGSSLYACQNCRYVTYCSPACQAELASAHEHECAALKRLKMFPPLDAESMTCARLLLQTMLRRRQHAEHGSKRIRMQHPTESLCSDLHFFRSQEFWSERVSALSAAFGSGCGAQLSWTSEELETLIAQVDCNSFLVLGRGEVEQLGLALYVAGSFFNHSCVPNVARVQRGCCLEFFALSNIHKGQRLCIAYVDPRLARSERRAHLLSVYGFHCQCERCESDSEAPSMCDRGHIGYLIPLEGRMWCSTCAPPPPKSDMLTSDDPSWELFD